MPDAPGLSITLIRTMMNHATTQVFIPIARAYAFVEAAALMVADAAQKFDQGRSTGKEANMAKLLASGSRLGSCAPTDGSRRWEGRTSCPPGGLAAPRAVLAFTVLRRC